MSDWTHLVPPEILTRRAAGPITLRCYCCGEAYERGHFICCAPPAGMKSRNWLALRCPEDRGGCGKCWKHCHCENKQDRAPKGPFADLAKHYWDEITATSRRPENH